MLEEDVLQCILHVHLCVCLFICAYIVYVFMCVLSGWQNRAGGSGGNLSELYSSSLLGQKDRCPPLSLLHVALIKLLFCGKLVFPTFTPVYYVLHIHARTHYMGKITPAHINTLTGTHICSFSKIGFGLMVLRNFIFLYVLDIIKPYI